MPQEFIIPHPHNIDDPCWSNNAEERNLIENLEGRIIFHIESQKNIAPDRRNPKQHQKAKNEPMVMDIFLSYLWPALLEQTHQYDPQRYHTEDDEGY